MQRCLGRPPLTLTSAMARAHRDQALFLDLLEQLSPRDRRVVAALVGRLADVEAQRGQAAALRLIDDIEAVICGGEC